MRDKVQASLGYTPPHLAERILNSRHALESERKHVTMLFADIKGSTALIENLDPEKTAGHLNPALSAMMEAVHCYEGAVNSVQGDDIMALFGATLAHAAPIRKLRGPPWERACSRTKDHRFTAFGQ